MSSYYSRSRYRTLDIDELNSRLQELEANRDSMEEAREAMEEAEAAFDEACKNQEDNQDAAIKALQEEFEKATDAFNDAENYFDDADAEELKKLEDLRDEIGERRGRIDDEGGPFVREEDFTEYAKELCEDIGDVPRDLPSYIEIDWDRTADNLRADYSEVEWEGETYLYRAR